MRLSRQIFFFSSSSSVFPKIKYKKLGFRLILGKGDKNNSNQVTELFFLFYCRRPVPCTVAFSLTDSKTKKEIEQDCNVYPANPLFCRFYEFINMHIFLSPSPFMVLFLFLRFLLVYVFACSVVLQPTPPTRLLFLNNNIKRNFHEYNNSRHAVYFKKMVDIYFSGYKKRFYVWSGVSRLAWPASPSELDTRVSTEMVFIWGRRWIGLVRLLPLPLLLTLLSVVVLELRLSCLLAHHSL